MDNTANIYELGLIRLIKNNISTKAAKYIHLAHESFFIQRFHNLININFKSNEHLILILPNTGHGTHSEYPENVIHIDLSTQHVSLLLQTLHKAQRIFLHGLWYDHYVDLLLSSDLLSKKTEWIIWGGDLYDSLVTEKKQALINNIRGIITHTTYDYNFAKTKFNTTTPWTGLGPFYDYGETPKKFDTLSVASGSKKTINILVGHSATRSLKHKEIFETIKEKYYQFNIKVFSVLSYGDSQYAQSIIDLGHKLFEKNFLAVTKIIKQENYYDFLNMIDIGIFAQQRSQGLGNITILLYLGKKVYIRHNTPHHEFITNLGGVTYDVTQIPKIDFEQFILNNDMQKNHIAMKSLKDGSLAVQEWKNILENPPLPSQ